MAQLDSSSYRSNRVASALDKSTDESYLKKLEREMTDRRVRAKVTEPRETHPTLLGVWEDLPEEEKATVCARIPQVISRMSTLDETRLPVFKTHFGAVILFCFGRRTLSALADAGNIPVSDMEKPSR